MDKDIPDVSPETLKLVKRYIPDMGISLPLNGETLCIIYKTFYGQEVSFAMEAEEIKKQNGDWESAEELSCMFAEAADELSDFDEDEDPDYDLLSEMIDKVVIEPDDVFPKLGI